MIGIIQFCAAKKHTHMNLKLNLQKILLIGAFFLLVFFRFFYTQQNMVIEISADTLIVFGLLAFGEYILSTLIQWPVYIISKTVQLMKFK